MKLKPLDQQTIVITGGSSGIGLATAIRAARAGANVVIIARGEEGLADAAGQIMARGGRCDIIRADVGDRTQVRQAVATVIERHGGFDTWVSNAGIGAYAMLEDLPDADHRQIFETNYWGVVHGATEALPHLKQHGGALITTGSISSQMPSPVLSAYTASKHAVKGYIDSLRLELMHEKAPVSVTLVQPSGINTPFSQHARNLLEDRTKVPPPVYSPDLVAEAICHAAQHPARDVIVGGGGRAMTLLAQVVPNIADRVLAASFFATALDKTKPKRTSTTGFDEGGGGGEVYGEQWMRRTSLYSSLRRNPVAAVAGVAGAAGLAGLILASGVVASARSRR